MERKFIFITGFFGAPLMQKAQQLAEETGLPLLVLDEEIEKADGRSARRICMMMGEHEYRNKEYEALKRITECALDKNSECTLEKTAESESLPCGAVVCCGDGVLHDDMSRDLIIGHRLEIVGGEADIDTLWENAKAIKNSTHAFMHFGTEEQQRAAFERLYERQRVLFMPYI